MTHALDALTRSINAALKTGQIGTPVAARVVVHQDADHGLVERLTARALEAAAGWLESRPERIVALGGAERGQISLVARFAGGQSALVSVSARGSGSPLMEAVIWGNRGTVSWEENAGFRDVESEADEPPLSEKATALLTMIREALASSASSAPGNDPSRNPASAPRLAPTPKPRWGVLLVAGDHTHQPNYAEALAADPRCKLIGLTDEADVSPRRRELNERLAKRLGIPMLPDLDAALRRDDVQIVSICAEPMRRGRIIIRAAAAGKHLYLDKPLAGSLRDAREIVAAVERAGVVSHMFTLTPLEPAQRMRRVVRSGGLGDVTGLHFDLCFAKGHAGAADLGRTRRESAEPQEYELPDAKRELTNVGVYPVAALLWLTGQRVRRVAATTGNYFFAEHQNRDMEDFGQMLLELESGAVATISAGRAGWRSHPSSGLNRTCVIGSQDAAVFDAHRPRAEVWADVPGWSAPERDPEDPMGMWAGPQAPKHTAAPKQSWITPPAAGPSADAAHFLDALEAGRPSEVPAATGAAATEILLAAYRSASQGGELVRVVQ